MFKLYWPAAIMENLNGLICATGDTIHFVFRSRIGLPFSVSARMALLPAAAGPNTIGIYKTDNK